jgi:hypothetical protein
MATGTQAKVLTAIVGSYPKPRYIYKQNGRSLLDSFGFSFDRLQQELGQAEFARLLDKAALEAIKDQNRAGIDIVTDGEERRGHYVLHIVNKLDGVDAFNRKPISMRAGTAEQDAPRVIGKIKHKQPIVLDEFLFTKKHAKGNAKIGLPGPSTVADCVADEYYRGDRKQLAFDYADAIRHEVAALITRTLGYPVRRSCMPRHPHQCLSCRHLERGCGIRGPATCGMAADIPIATRAKRHAATNFQAITVISGSGCPSPAGRHARGGGEQAGCFHIERYRQENGHAGRG